MRAPGLGILALALALALFAGCGLELPAPHVRVAAGAPEGSGAPVDGACEVRFTGQVAPVGLVDGARLVLVPEGARAAALAAVESEAGAAGLPGAVRARIVLADGGRRAVLAPEAPLRGRGAYALVVGSGLLDEDGRPVLDAQGRPRPTVFAFETAAPPGPPPVPVLVEVRADAETPEAGGEYAELVNLGEGELDLWGWRLAKRTASGATASCLLEPDPGDAVPSGGAALVAGGAWDGRYAVPAGVPVLRCGTAALLGGLSNDSPPELALVDPDGAVVSTFGAGGTTPRCPEAAVRLDPRGPDAAWNLACAEGTPGWGW